MNKNKLWLAALLLLAGLGLASTASATLIPRTVGGDEMVYDSDLDITWVKNANLGAGSSFDDGFDTTDGRMTWNNAVAWADALVYGGKDDWRLPVTGPINGTSFQTGFSNNGTTDVGYGNTRSP